MDRNENKEKKMHVPQHEAPQYLSKLEFQQITQKKRSQQYIPPTGPPKASSKPSQEIYECMGEENIFRMIEDFYIGIADSKISFMFAKNIKQSSQRLAAFIVFICGGPPMYQQRYGEPQLRERHVHFPIDESARREWLDCFDRVLEDSERKYNFPQQHLEGFRKFLLDFSAWLVNKETNTETKKDGRTP